MEAVDLKNFQKFKDGDDGESSVYLNVNIEEVDNGYIVKHFDGEDEATYVFQDVVQLLEHLHGVFGEDSE